MNRELTRLQETWETLGRDDPLWAVASLEEKRGNKWELAEFYATGEQDVQQIVQHLRQLSTPPEKFGCVLDFGCGPGRLANAWSSRATQVIGIDISEPMVQKGREWLKDKSNIELKVNTAENLHILPDGSIDLVCSLVSLQHIPWPIAGKYVSEFGRVAKPGGWVIFQLPAKRAGTSFLPALRKFLVDLLPFGLSRQYRRWRHGSGAAYSMYFTPPDKVISVAKSAGLTLVDQQPDVAAGTGTQGYLYFFRRKD